MKRENKITPSGLRRQAEAMVATGTMPSLEAVLKAVAESRNGDDDATADSDAAL